MVMHGLLVRVDRQNGPGQPPKRFFASTRLTERGWLSPRLRAIRLGSNSASSCVVVCSSEWVRVRLSPGSVTA